SDQGISSSLRDCPSTSGPAPDQPATPSGFATKTAFRTNRRLSASSAASKIESRPLLDAARIPLKSEASGIPGLAAGRTAVGFAVVSRHAGGFGAFGGGRGRGRGGGRA